MTTDTRSIYVCRDCGATEKHAQPPIVPACRPGEYEPRDSTLLTIRCRDCGGIMDPTTSPDARKQIGLDWRT